MGILFSLGDPARHFWLTRSVARIMGVNLSEAMSEGRLSAQGLRAHAVALRRREECRHEDCDGTNHGKVEEDS